MSDQHREPRDVTSEVLRLFPKLLSAQMTKGIRTYGHTLKTFNGRDAGQDAAEELIDAFCYLVQLQMEHRDLLAENECLRAVLREHGLLVAPDGSVVEIEP